MIVWPRHFLGWVVGGAGKEWKLSRIFRRLHGLQSLIHFWIRRAGGPRRQAAGAHDVETAEHIRMLHADACRAIASHRVTDQAAACSIWNRAVMSVDVLDNIVSDELLEVSGSDRTRIHGTVVQGFRIGQHDDHLFRALGKSAFNRLRNVNLVSPLFSADGIAMQRIYDWVASRLFLGVTRRQKHEYFAVNGVAL